MPSATKSVLTLVAVMISSLGPASADATETVAYRLTAGNTMHFNDPGLAQQHFAAVKKLGCDAKQVQHAGHIDISYRTTHWKSLDLASPTLARQWETWLKGAGFETMRGYAANDVQHHQTNHSHGPRQVEQVAYRLADWKIQNFDDPAQYEEFVSLMKAFGCEVQTQSQGGQLDVRIRCRDWNHVDLPTHDIASIWQIWLARNGFDVQHQH